MELIQNYQSLLQVLGQNSEAKEVLATELASAFPTLEPSQGVSETIIDKFYNWSFPFRYTTDGGGARRWRTKVRAWIMRNARLKDFDTAYNALDGAGELKEIYGGEDTTTFTDSRESVNTEEYNALGSVSSGLANKNTQGFTAGKNTTETVHERGTTRTYADGRTAEERLADWRAVMPPVYEFINGFAGLLVPPIDFYTGE